MPNKTRRFLKIAAIYGLITLICSSCALWSDDRSAQDQPVWFDDLASTRPLEEVQRKAIATTISKTLFENSLPYFGRIDDPQARIIFLSVSDGQSRARVFHSTARGAHTTARELISIASSKLKRPPQWVKVDFAQAITGPVPIGPEEEVALPAYLWGMALPARSRVAFVPGEVLGNAFISSNDTLNTENITRYLKKKQESTARARHILQNGQGSFRRFQSVSYFSDGQQVERLEYGKRSVQKVTPARLMAALENAGSYLARSVRPNGRFVYEYNPTDDSVPEKYNMVRHAGTIYSMFQVAQIVDNPEVSHAAQRASKFLVDHMKKAPLEEQDGYCVVAEKRAKLGSNALGVLALVEQAKATDSSAPLKNAAKLARWIVSIQSESGRFSVHRQIHPTGQKVIFRCQYYPGEVIFALLRLYQADGNPQWLKTAEKSARYLITQRDKNKTIEQLQHDHWLLYGLNELYRVKPRKIYLQHARRLARAIAESQNLEPRNPAWRGSYYRPPRSAPTATRSEGLCAAYFLENDHGDKSRAEQFFKAALRGVEFQLLTQIRPPTAMYFANPPRAIGGFTYSLTDPRIRIDVVQHNISSLLSMRRMLMER